MNDITTTSPIHAAPTSRNFFWIPAVAAATGPLTSMPNWIAPRCSASGPWQVWQASPF
jgi:hypothetical protein